MAYLGANCAPSIDQSRVNEPFLGLLYIWIVESPADETLQATDGVPQIGGFLSFSCLADCSLLGSKSDERSKDGIDE